MNSEDTCAHRELLSLRVLLAFSTVILGKVENEYILRFHSTVSNDIAKQALIDTEKYPTSVALIITIPLLH